MALSRTHAFDELIKELEKRDKNEVTTMTEVMPQFIQVKLDRAKKETTKDRLVENSPEGTMVPSYFLTKAAWTGQSMPLKPGMRMPRTTTPRT